MKQRLLIFAGIVAALSATAITVHTVLAPETCESAARSWFAACVAGQPPSSIAAFDVPSIASGSGLSQQEIIDFLSVGCSVGAKKVGSAEVRISHERRLPDGGTSVCVLDNHGQEAGFACTGGKIVGLSILGGDGEPLPSCLDGGWP